MPFCVGSPGCMFAADVGDATRRACNDQVTRGRGLGSLGRGPGSTPSFAGAESAEGRTGLVDLTVSLWDDHLAGYRGLATGNVAADGSPMGARCVPMGVRRPMRPYLVVGSAAGS